MGIQKGTTRRWLACLVIAAVALGAAATARAAGEKMLPGRVMAMSKYGFDETVSRVKQAIEGQQMMVVFTADHQAMLQMVGLQTKGMAGIEFFHPRYGKVIVQNDHAAGLDTPLRLVVMEGDMGTVLTYEKPSHTFAKYPKLKKLGEELDGVLAAIQASVAK
ncbi:MAG: DUF302 domain-containing protein [candidate division NC10 bacterium]|nr:DUF302 domain-containing protein [candidate division NC10 bacterium]